MQNGHAQVYEALKLEEQNYQVEVHTGETESDIITYLQGKGIIDSDYIINVTKLIGSTLSTGKGTGTTDVYKLEEMTQLGKVASVEGIQIADTGTNKTYIVVYYDAKGTRAELGTIGESTTSSGNDSEVGVELISKTDSYVGYYADINADGTPDGIIYADLLCGPFGGETSGYTISSDDQIQADNSKDYYVKVQNYEGAFITNDVLAPTGSGQERFYIMALEDFTDNGSSTFTWYASAYPDELYDETIPMVTNKGFGTGKDNSGTMLTKWNDGYYGQPAADNNDVWGAIGTKVNDGWFLPSQGEWAAFIENLDITTENYSNLNLGGNYWSSSQYSQWSATCWDCRNVWHAKFYSYSISSSGNGYNVSDRNSVRLSTTF